MAPTAASMTSEEKESAAALGRCAGLRSDSGKYRRGGGEAAHNTLIHTMYFSTYKVLHL